MALKMFLRTRVKKFLNIIMNIGKGYKNSVT